MPFLELYDVHALVGRQATGTDTLDLRGASVGHARIAIRMLLAQVRSPEPTTVVIRLDPATAVSGETLFLPVGRQLLDARRRGLVNRFHPLPIAEGGGFYVELPGPPVVVAE